MESILLKNVFVTKDLILWEATTRVYL